jgi:hypothetical protein
LIDVKEVESGLQLLIGEEFVQLEVGSEELGVVNGAITVDVDPLEDLLDLDGGPLH